MLSGIGDEAELRSHGISTRVNVPGVGKHLQDHPFFAMDWVMHEGFHDRVALLNSPEALQAARKEFAEQGIGLFQVMFNSMAMVSLYSWSSMLADVLKRLVQGYFRNDTLSPPQSSRSFQSPQTLESKNTSSAQQFPHGKR